MRRILVVTVVLASLGMGAIPAGAAGVGGGGEQVALADWTVWTSKTHGVWYVAEVDRGVEAPFVMNDAFVFKGACTRTFLRHGFLEECSAGGTGHSLGPTEFQMDPMLNSASLDFTDGRYHQQVHWTGQGQSATPGEGGDVDPGSASAYGTVGEFRPAKATAHVFGTTLRPQRFSFTLLSIDGGAGIDGLDLSVRDGVLHASLSRHVR